MSNGGPGPAGGGPDGQVVRLHVWRVSRRAVPLALARMALDRSTLRAADGLLFGKLLGTSRGTARGAAGQGDAGHGGGFGPAHADLTRYAAVTVWTDPAAAAGFETGPVVRGWSRLATVQATLDLTAISSRGRWSGREPFAPASAGRTDGPVLALTRARLRPLRTLTFWRAVPPVVGALRDAPGVLVRFGIGEAPIGWQGTISVWRSAAELVDFAYRQPEHRAAIARTATEGWYAEELFTRFAINEIRGDPTALGWTEGKDSRR